MLCHLHRFHLGKVASLGKSQGLLDILNQDRLERMVTDTIIVLELLEEALSSCADSTLSLQKSSCSSHAELGEEVHHLLSVVSHDERNRNILNIREESWLTDRVNGIQRGHIRSLDPERSKGRGTLEENRDFSVCIQITDVDCRES
jgi:hypothetical protein